MAHEQNIIDTDLLFQIDAITREIVNMSLQKTRLIQFDHNSERFGFECPRYIEGHDMADCDKIEIHYINISSNEENYNSDVYLVSDKQVSPDKDDTVVFSWLISSNATQYAGTLSFLIRFVCHEGNSPVYIWNSSIFRSISVAEGMNYSAEVVEEYSDVLAAKLDKNQGAANVGKMLVVDEYGNLSLTDSIKADSKSAYEIAKENGFVGTVEEWLASLKGESGATPYIQDGYWYIDGKNTGVKAQGNLITTAIPVKITDTESYKQEQTHDANTLYMFTDDPILEEITPTVSLTKEDGKTTLSVTDVNGTNTVEILDGAKGEKGEKGETGAKGDTGETGAKGDTGAEGVSPTVTINEGEGQRTLEIVDKNGTHSTTIKDGVSPTVSLTKDGITTTLSITDKNGTQSADIIDGSSISIYRNIITLYYSKGELIIERYSKEKLSRTLAGSRSLTNILSDLGIKDDVTTLAIIGGKYNDIPIYHGRFIDENQLIIEHSSSSLAGLTSATVNCSTGLSAKIVSYAV